MTWLLMLIFRLTGCMSLIRLLMEIARACGLDMLTASGFRVSFSSNYGDYLTSSNLRAFYNRCESQVWKVFLGLESIVRKQISRKVFDISTVFVLVNLIAYSTTVFLDFGYQTTLLQLCLACILMCF